MKQFLLLAALAAPLVASAQDPAPAPEAGMPVLRYEMPKGTFYGGTEAEVKLLPPMVELTWANASYYAGDAITPAALMTDADFTWRYRLVTDRRNPVESEGSDLVTPATYAFPGSRVRHVTAPVLRSVEAGNAGYTRGAVYFGKSETVQPWFTTYEQVNTESKAVEAYTFGSEAANNMWADYCREISNARVSGFAQRLEYAGAPYMLDSLGVNFATELADGDSFVVSVYEAPGDDGILPATPLTSVTAKVKVPQKSDNGSADGSASVATDGSAPGVTYVSVKFEGLRITSPVVVVISDFSVATFSPKVVVKSAPAYEPAPEGQGLYALVAGTDAQGNSVNQLAAIDEPDVAVDGTQSLPVALDLCLAVSYPYFIPYKEVSSETDVLGQEAIKVYLDGTVTLAQYLCVSSAKAEDITVTLPDGSELPGWVKVDVADVTATSDVTGAAADTQAVILSISQPSTTGGVTPIAVNLPGLTSTVFTVVIDVTGGIDGVESASPVVGREYYDLSGRRLSDAPRSGFYIEKAIRADGTSTATRHIR